jgi:hypothetical protein
MDTHRLQEFIGHNPDYVPILQKAVKHEDENAANQHYLGWEWFNVEAYPARLMYLVVNGLTRVNFKSRRSTCYLLKDKEATKEALKGLGY